MGKLIIEGINFSYEHDKLLDNVFFEMKNPGNFGLMGLNGAGKSTFFNCLSGYNNFETGLLKINDRIIKNDKRWKHFSYLNQKNFLPFDMKVKQAIKLFSSSEIIDERIEELRSIKIGKLSSGEKRYLENLIILGMNREFIILDEPFSEIEPLYIAKLSKLIKEKSKEHGIIITDHNHHAVRSVCDEIGILRNRRIIKIKNTDEELRLNGYYA